VAADNEPLIEDAYRILSDLGALLKDNMQNDSAAMEAALSRLEGCDYEADGDLIPWLREQLDNLEYEVLRSKLENL
jgi:hypothetical protein